MKTLYETDIYNEYLDKGTGVNAITAKTKEIIKGNNTKFLTYKDLEAVFDNMKKQFKDPVVLKIIDAIQKDRLRPFYVLNKSYNLPVNIPFIKFKENGVWKVIVNLSAYLTISKDPESGYTTYNIDNRILYCLLLPAYLNLNLFDKNYVLNPKALEIASTIWARMFCKVLNRTISLNTSKERYEAFMYFAIRFFLKYIMECTDKVVDDISEQYLTHGKSYIINNMELVIKEKGLEPYTNFESFCRTMFNNEVSNIKGVRSYNISEAVSPIFYVKEFIKLYDYSAVLALATFPYFLYVIISTNYKVKLVSDTAFEDVAVLDNKEYVQLFNTILSEV